jgi:uncharacterized protein YdeI (YjbR/CyaY-like superfamily)
MIGIYLDVAGGFDAGVVVEVTFSPEKVELLENVDLRSNLVPINMSAQNTTDLPILFFIDQADFETWLEDHHSDGIGVRIKIAKKGSGTTSIDYQSAVESALCYGWIDSQASALDDQFYLQKFSARKSKSKWSKLNCEKAQALINAGRMKPSGYHQVEAAKADGRWEAAYDPQSQITIPDDFQHELDHNTEAKMFFTTLNSQNRYAFLHRLQEAKKPETRSTRIKKFITMLEKHEKIYP